jgi:flagellar motor switch/type III secretory pathway protein FliN
MSARPYSLLGRSEIERVQQIITNVFELWCEEWLAEHPSYSVLAKAAPAAGYAEQALQNQWCRLNQDENCIYWLSNLEADEWHSLLFGQSMELVHSGGQVIPLAHSVVEEAVKDLFQSIFRQLNSPAHSSNIHFESKQTIPANQLTTGSAAIAVEIGLQQGGLKIMINHALAEQYLRGEPLKQNRAAVELPKHIVHAQRVKVQAWIGEAQIDIASLRSLAVGDIIPLNRAIDHPISARIADGQALGQAFLGSSGDYRALEIVQ